MFHSDRGVQYTSKQYRDLLALNKITPSMSGKGNCYDNAKSESFFSNLKNELVHRLEYQTRKEAFLSGSKYFITGKEYIPLSDINHLLTSKISIT